MEDPCCLILLEVSPGEWELSLTPPEGLSVGLEAGDLTPVFTLPPALLLDFEPDLSLLLDLGVPGPRGPAGPGGGGYYQHNQDTPADLWTVEHNLGRKPAGVRVEDSYGVVVEGGMAYVDLNTLILTWAGAMTGRAYIS